MKNRAIIVVDFQKDYLPSGKWALAGIDAAVDNAAKIIEAARASGTPIFHVRHESGEDAPFFVAGTDGAEIIPAVQPKDGEAVVTKNYPNAFRDTNLKALLDAEGIKEVAIVGAMTHMCIDATARAAADFGYSVLVAHDATASRDVEFAGKTIPAADTHAAFLSALGFAYGQVVSSDELI
jgi:nicotinamidase-related amidase